MRAYTLRQITDVCKQNDLRVEKKGYFFFSLLVIRFLERLMPAPGTAKAPGPMTVPPDKLRTLLGVRQVSLVSAKAPLAVVDTPLT